MYVAVSKSSAVAENTNSPSGMICVGDVYSSVLSNRSGMIKSVPELIKPAVGQDLWGCDLVRAYPEPAPRDSWEPISALSVVEHVVAVDGRCQCEGCVRSGLRDKCTQQGCGCGREFKCWDLGWQALNKHISWRDINIRHWRWCPLNRCPGGWVFGIDPIRKHFRRTL